MPYDFQSAKSVKIGACVKIFKIGLVADMDRRSKATDDKGYTIWKSYILTGSLTYDYTNQKAEIEMHPQNEAVAIESTFSRGMRGMELSELIAYEEKFYAVCDKTGIVFQMCKGKAIPRIILANGDGNEDTGFKGEWMTLKNGNLIVGSHGREYVENGTIIVNRNKKWIKEIDPNGRVKHIDWNAKYDAMRNALGCSFPGYLTHEAAAWSDFHHQWFFLPRKVSRAAYDAKKDETRCGNVLIKCNEDFTAISFVTVGAVMPSRGYSSFKFVPGTNDHVIIAIKSEEVGSIQKTFITVFTIEGRVMVHDIYVADVKYEGLEFI